MTGQYLEPIHLTNVGSVPCSLPGTPTLFGVRTGAPPQAIGLRDGRGSSVDGRGGAPFRQTDLQPGGRATITLDIPYSFFLTPGQACARDNPHRPAPFDSLVVGLAAAGTVDVPGTLPYLECAPMPASILTAGFVVDGSDDPLPEPVDRLQVRIDAPRSARGGTTVFFSVVLSNPTAETVPLDPCPGYWALLRSLTDSTLHLQLNCDTVREIAPGQAVRFAMRIHVPPGAHDGSIDFDFDTPAALAGLPKHPVITPIQLTA